MPETKVTISLGVKNYAVTKQQLEDTEKALRRIGQTLKTALAEGKENLVRGILSSLGVDLSQTAEQVEDSSDKIKENISSVRERLAKEKQKIRQELHDFRRLWREAFPGAKIPHPLEIPRAQPGQVPPKMGGPQGVNMQQAAVALATSFFSSWVAARMFNQAFRGFPFLRGATPAGRGGGGGGGIGGGISNAIFGAGGIPGFGEWYSFLNAIHFVTSALKNELGDAIKEGAKLYQQSARTAVSTQQLAQLNPTLGATGINPSILSGAGAMSFRTGGSLYQQTLRAAMMTGNPETIQNVINMRKEIEFMGERTKAASFRLSDASNAMQRITMSTIEFKNEWRVFWTDMVRYAEPWIQMMLGAGTALAQMGDFIIKNLGKASAQTVFGPVLGPIISKIFGKATDWAFEGGGKKKTDLALLAGPNQWQGRGSPWEKMGLIMSGGLAGTDYARQTAYNTKIIADYVRVLFPMNNPTAAMGGMQVPFNLP